MNVLHGTDILLYGTVGLDWCDDGFTVMDVIAALTTLGPDTPVTVRINSGGGYAFEGLAIYSALSAHRGKVTCVVDSIAASAASIIAMAGDEVVMRLGSMMMIHDPATITWGDQAEHLGNAEFLGKLGDSLAEVYAAKTKRSAAECRQEMIAESWLTADDAVARGYADRLAPAAALDDPSGLPDPEREGEGEGGEVEPPEPTAFDFRVYTRAPERLAAAAAARGWTNGHPLAAVASMPEPPMSKASAKSGETISDDPPVDTEKARAALAASVDAARLAASEIVRLCVDGGEPLLAAELVRSGADAATVTARLTAATEIRSAVGLARRQAPEIEATIADRAIAAGASLEAVRADLFARISAAEAAAPATIAAHQPGQIGRNVSTSRIDPAAIWNRHNHPAA
jgi:ATP-dependent protease ClpP protease subunit